MSRDSAYLEHILEATANAMQFAADGRELFFRDLRTRSAIILPLIVIGEATKHISTQLRREHPEVAWRRMAGRRDVLVHNYMGVDQAIGAILDEERRG